MAILRMLTILAILGSTVVAIKFQSPGLVIWWVIVSVVLIMSVATAKHKITFFFTTITAYFPLYLFYATEGWFSDMKNTGEDKLFLMWIVIGVAALICAIGEVYYESDDEVEKTDK